LLYNYSKPLTSREHRPSNITQIEKWFIEEEKPKNCGLKKSGTVEPWFHGRSCFPAFTKKYDYK